MATVASRPVVTVSIPPLNWFVEAIAGDSVDVNVMLATGANPETFEPGISSMREVADSRAVFITGGLPFEKSVADKMTGGTIVNVSEGVEPLFGTHEHCGRHNHVHTAGVADPHTWTSVKNGRIIARNIFETLKSVDPSRETYYSERYHALDSHLDSLDRAIESRLDSIESRSFLVMHPSLGYFARDYGLTQISMGQEGRESSVKGVRRQLDIATAEGAGVLFLQVDFDSRVARNVAVQTDAQIVDLNLLNADWEQEIEHIVDALTSR